VTEAEIEAINADASVLMKQGMVFLEETRREAPIDALHCFDEALALRRRIPADHSPFQGYLLAACLLNRADALVRLNDSGPLAAALDSYDEGIAVLQALPLEADPRYPRRLAMAYQNRALALHVQGNQAAAIESLLEGIAVLEAEQAAAVTDRDALRAAAWLNLAMLRLAAGAQEEAHAAAGKVLGLVADREQDDLQSAALGLQARHVLCRICADRLTNASEGDDPSADVHDATDAVDEGLALVRNWEQRGVAIFRPLAFDLFRFGARVYARHQPQFLDEFIKENTDPTLSSPGFVDDPDMAMAMHEARQLLP
jgi:tetratricopeptide (TPR) repeat protein